MSQQENRNQDRQPPGPEQAAEESLVLPPGADQVNGWPGWMGPAAQRAPRRRGDPRRSGA